MLTLIINFFPFYSTIVDGFLIVYQLGICCVYIVFVAQNIQVFLDDFTFFKGTSLSMYIIALFIPLCLLACIRNLKLLAPFSTLANVLTFIGLYTFQSIFLTKSIFQISFVCVCFNEIRFFSSKTGIALILKYVFEGLEADKLSTYDAVNPHFAEFPLFFGTTLFAIEAVGVVVALENNMKTPKSFGARFGVLNVGMTVITLLYAVFGFLGYWRYGAESKDSVTLNLPSEDM